jgi:hypothetical protein
MVMGSEVQGSGFRVQGFRVERFSVQGFGVALKSNSNKEYTIIAKINRMRQAGRFSFLSSIVLDILSSNNLLNIVRR